MSKRANNFERKPRDFYKTPQKAIEPLIPHLGKDYSYIEPCAGDGALVEHLNMYGYKCVLAFDIEPQNNLICKKDALKFNYNGKNIITNPPWDRKILHPMIKNMIETAGDVWLLFDADWIHTKQSKELIKNCHKIVSIGRLKWIEGSKYTGKDNCCWYLFKKEKTTNTQFIGR